MVFGRLWTTSSNNSPILSEQLGEVQLVCSLVIYLLGSELSETMVRRPTQLVNRYYPTQ
jgi:hypothetical protein